MTTIRKLFRIVFPEQPADPLEDEHPLPMDHEYVC